MKEKIVTIFLIILISFIAGITVVNAEDVSPKISIEGDDYITVTETMIDSYILTIDYSSITDLTELRIYYKVNEGEDKEFHYNENVTSDKLTIRGNEFEEGKCLQKIYVYAENENGKSEVLEKEFLVINYSAEKFSDPNTGVSGELMRYPINTTVEIEVINDISILNKLSHLDTTTVYKITPKVEGKEAGPLLKKFGCSKSTSYITVDLPIPEEIAQTAKYGDKIGYVFNQNFTEHKTISYMKKNPINFVLSTGEYIYDNGTAYYTIATEKKTEKPTEPPVQEPPDNSNVEELPNKDEGTTQKNNIQNDNTTAKTVIPNTGITSIIIIVILLLVISIIAFIKYRNHKGI